MQKWIDIKYKKPEEGQWITACVKCHSSKNKTSSNPGKTWFSFKTFSYDPSHKKIVNTINYYSIDGKGTYTQQITHWVPVLDPP